MDSGRWASALAEAAPSSEVTRSGTYAGDDRWVIVEPDGVRLGASVRLRVELDEGWFVVTDDFSDVYAEGETYEAGVDAYFSALRGLERLLAEREGELDADVRERLARMRAVLP